MSVHFIPFVRQMQFDSWHERLHLQARRVSTALGAGDPSIQSIVSCCSSSFHPFLQDPVFPDHLPGSFSRLQLDSWHGWYAFLDSLNVEVTDVILHHLSLRRTKNNASMLVVARLVAYSFHTNSSNFTCKFGVRFHCTQSCANASLKATFASNMISVRILPFPTNAPKVSQLFDLDRRKSQTKSGMQMSTNIPSAPVCLVRKPLSV